ncbi:beta-1,4-galactosyltransferase 4-like [Argopecten irradians]|uniref:beta-1,4-galactosyltransferase 4-like n=1 Tax=Argopecten irradians TaxID=31199 RepID=UPI00371D832B
MSSINMYNETGQKSSPVYSCLTPQGIVVFPCRLRVILRIFVMTQIIVGIICIYVATTYSFDREERTTAKNEHREKIRNIRQFAETESRTTKKPLPPCPEVPKGLVGKVKVDFATYEMIQIEKLYPDLQNGGRYKPSKCTARHRVAIIIPYRNRKSHLITLMNNLHKVLQRQQLDYGIYVVEVAPMSDFNRALCLNIGFIEASRDYDYQCFIFHDVDLIPENDRNMYTCPKVPRHMSVAVDRLKYKLPYSTIFGGVVAMSKEDFYKVNGFSNKFFGWGGEDDDMSKRLRTAHLNFTRYSPDIARYKMLSHKKDSSVNQERFYLLRHTNETWRTDGLNSLTYKHIKTDRHKLFTYILADIDPNHQAYYTDRLKIVQESLQKMREDMNKTKLIESKGGNSSHPNTTSSHSTKRTKKHSYRIPSKKTNLVSVVHETPKPAVHETSNTAVHDKPNPAGSLHPMQQLIKNLQQFLRDEGQKDVNAVPDKDLANFIRGFVNKMSKAGFSITSDMKFRKKEKTQNAKAQKLRKGKSNIKTDGKW